MENRQENAVLKFPMLLSPKKIGGHILKNRIICPPSKPPFLQGAESYPTQQVIDHYARRAKNGASNITIVGASNPRMNKLPHNVCWDVYDDRCQHYLSQLSEALHYYNTLCTMSIHTFLPEGYDVSTGVPSCVVPGDGSVAVTGTAVPAELLTEIAEKTAQQAYAVKESGFDGVYLHMAYGLTPLGRFLSPLTNKRTDEYGGSLENRSKWPIFVMQKIKERCGKDFIIEASLTGADLAPNGWTLEDSIGFTELADGFLDIMHVRSWNIDYQNCTGFELNPQPFLDMAEHIRKGSHASVQIAVTGGFQMPDVCEAALVEGKADLIAMARPFICDPEFGTKIQEGRSEDIVPCLRCNKCHKSSYADAWTSVCSVNPTWGIEHRLNTLVSKPQKRKKVAVVGGGPGGMNAALLCADRGHEVVLFEKKDHLGGQLSAAVIPSFKWPLKNFLQYQLRQIKKSPVQVRLNTEVGADDLAALGFDAIIAATGAVPAIPDIPGMEKAFRAEEIYGNEHLLGPRVAVIGGGEIGVETAMHLAERGHSTTVLEMTDQLAKDCTPIHYRSMFEDAWKKLKNFHYILNARCVRTDGNTVVYLDQNRAEQILTVDSIVLAAGMRPRQLEAMSMRPAAIEFYMAGDCIGGAGNLQKTMRSSYAAASQI